MLILQAQEMYQRGLSRTAISDVLGVPIKRLRQYLSGDAETLCKDGRSYAQKASSLDAHHVVIGDMLVKKTSYREVHQALKEMGIKISYSTLCHYCDTRFAKDRLMLKNPPIRHSVSRRQILDHIWSDKELDPTDRTWLVEKYPELPILKDFVVSFREAFESTACFEEWISSAKSASIPAIRSFAGGLERDRDAVFNAVKFQKSNGFLEGNVNRLKMIKRSMFGRAGLDLLTAKVVGQTHFC